MNSRPKILLAEFGRLRLDGDGFDGLKLIEPKEDAGSREVLGFIVMVDVDYEVDVQQEVRRYLRFYKEVKRYIL